MSNHTMYKSYDEDIDEDASTRMEEFQLIRHFKADIVLGFDQKFSSYIEEAILYNENGNGPFFFEKAFWYCNTLNEGNGYHQGGEFWRMENRMDFAGQEFIFYENDIELLKYNIPFKCEEKVTLKGIETERVLKKRRFWLKKVVVCYENGEYIRSAMAESKTKNGIYTILNNEYNGGWIIKDYKENCKKYEKYLENVGAIKSKWVRTENLLKN